MKVFVDFLIFDHPLSLQLSLHGFLGALKDGMKRLFYSVTWNILNSLLSDLAVKCGSSFFYRRLQFILELFGNFLCMYLMY